MVAVALTLALLLGQSTTTTTPTQVNNVPLLTINSSQAATVFGTSGCAGTISGAWALRYTQQNICSFSRLKVWTTSGNCENEPAGTDVTVVDRTPNAVDLPATGTAGTFDIQISKLPGFVTTNDGGVACGQPKTNVNHKVCASFPTGNLQQFTGIADCSSNATNWNKATSLDLNYDSVPPDPPTLGDVIGLDQKLIVNFTRAAETETMIAYHQGPDDANPIATESTSNVDRIEIDGLTNGVDYTVYVVGVDAAGNASDPSETKTGRPIETHGIWQAVKDDGGEPATGCSSVGLGSLAVLALGTWIVRRRAQR